MKRSCLLVVLLMLSACGPGKKPAPDDSAQDELEKFHQDWQIVSYGNQRADQPKNELYLMHLSFKDDTLTIQLDKDWQHFTLKLDPAKEPKTIDLLPFKDDHHGGPRYGIYRFEGDTLMICWSGDKDNRPTEFVNRPGSFLVVLKRRPSAEEVRRIAERQIAARQELQGTWKVREVIHDGKERGGWMGEVSEIRIEEDRFILVWPGDRPPTDYRLVLESDKTPRAIHIHGEKEGAMRGSYRLDGNKLTLCHAQAGDALRPTEFVSTKGSGVTLYRLEK